MVSFAVSVSAVEKPGQGKDLLRATYQRVLPRMETSLFGLPLYLESFEQGHKMHVDIYGVFDYPFGGVVDLLNVPSNWCDIVPLHPNVKACTYEEEAGVWLLTFYLGRKTAQPLADTNQVVCRYQNVDQQQEYQDITLIAEKGPYGTSNHNMRFEALPLEGERTFVHVSYSYSDSAALRLATKLYFATLGRGKVGFTVVGTDINDGPVYIGGVRGAVERSAIRYYFAIQSFMDTLRFPEEGRFGLRINQWYDFTTRFRAQLFDLEKGDYIKSKTAEHAGQMRLQRQIGMDIP